MLTVKRIMETLGGTKVLGETAPTQAGLMACVRTGLPYKSFTALSSAFDVDPREMVAIVRLPPRTLARRKTENRLRADESDRLLRVARVAVLAEDVLGSRERAVRWLRSPIRALNNETPLKQMDTDLGAREVENILLRTAHGVHS
jgi:putative toxin-antitoxin system antitoxin component (TIGR02293 family)